MEIILFVDDLYMNFPYIADGQEVGIGQRKGKFSEIKRWRIETFIPRTGERIWTVKFVVELILSPLDVSSFWRLSLKPKTHIGLTALSKSVLHKKKSINGQVASLREMVISQIPACEKLDLEFIKRERMQREVSLADQIRAAKSKRAQSAMREALTELSPSYPSSARSS
ncbi:hypothetical protein CK203_021646 [Vitis vinifera]|uniref:Uncharacterized protein n=1 Tax=Vitis vinifera TaxID=29760 RepID=A0A438J4D3_VITVI|nr:hypothetical protein CK203_021646 [Vitis vinifera]